MYGCGRLYSSFTCWPKNAKASSGMYWNSSWCFPWWFFSKSKVAALCAFVHVCVFVRKCEYLCTSVCECACTCCAFVCAYVCVCGCASMYKSNLCKSMFGCPACTFGVCV